MFRNTQEVFAKYGVGTLVSFTRGEVWLITHGTARGHNVQALNLHTLAVDSFVSVVDPEWITKLEFEELFNFTGYTLTDFTLHANVKVSELHKYKY